MVCCFANPSSAPARMPPFQLAEFHPALTHHPIQSSCMDCSTSTRGRRTGPSPLQAARVTSRTLSNPSRRRRLRRERYAFVSSARHFVPMRAEPMKISRSECGDPVCRPIRLRCSGFRSLTWPAPPTSQEGRLVRSRWRGIVSGRFRVRKLVGSGGNSKCFFAAVFPQAMLAAHALGA
jgi:hypothetical protein